MLFLISFTGQVNTIRRARSLYQQFKAEGESFKPKYLKILSAGGSEAPAKVLADAGINIRDPKFWQGGFDVLEKLVSELEKLPVEGKAKAKVKSKKAVVKKALATSSPKGKKTVKAKPAKRKAGKKK